MVQRPPNDDDPTVEEELPEFDGANTNQLDDNQRSRVVASSENANGAVSFDDRGRAQWKWITELGPTRSDATGTFDQLKALDNPVLSLENEAPAPPKPSSKTGYDPYATGVFEKPKTRR